MKNRTDPIRLENSRCLEEYPTAYYHALHTGNPGDLDFYLRACSGAPTVLELGCGIGRIGQPLLLAGHEVVGLDIDPRALRRAAESGLETVLADMRSFELKRRFERIIIPYNGLYCLSSESDMIECLTCAREHLSAEGQIIFDGYAGDTLDDDLHTSAEPCGESSAQILVDGCTWDVYEHAVWDPLRQQVDVTYVHKSVDGGDSVTGVIRQRYLYSYEVPDLLESAGLMLASLHGGFDERPFDEESELLVVRAVVSIV